MVTLRPVRWRILWLALLWLGFSVGGPATAQGLPPKPPLRGLVSMGRIEFYRQDGGVPDNSLRYVEAADGAFAGVVVHATWDQLQPRQGVLVTAAVDEALVAVRGYNRAHPDRPLGVRLRIRAGPNAPGWAKALGGPPLGIAHLDRQMTLGRFWSISYRDAWRDLQRRLAARLDADPLVREVANTSCSSVTGEPFLVPAAPEALAILHGAGFTDAQFRACLLESPADYVAWATTRIVFPINPLRAFDSGRPVPDVEGTLRLMSAWRQDMGQRGILGNHSLQDPLPPHLLPIYAKLRELGAPLAFQTHSPRGLEWEATMRSAVLLGANSVEVWVQTRNGGHATMSVETLRRWSDMLGGS